MILSEGMSRRAGEQPECFGENCGLESTPWRRWPRSPPPEPKQACLCQSVTSPWNRRNVQDVLVQMAGWREEAGNEM